MELNDKIPNTKSMLPLSAPATQTCTLIHFTQRFPFSLSLSPFPISITNVQTRQPPSTCIPRPHPPRYPDRLVLLFSLLHNLRPCSPPTTPQPSRPAPASIPQPVGLLNIFRPQHQHPDSSSHSLNRARTENNT